MDKIHTQKPIPGLNRAPTSNRGGEAKGSALSVSNGFLEFETRKGRLKVLEDFSLQIEEGEFVCVVGPSGCGKTSLLNVLAGLLKLTKGTAKSGDLEIDGPGIDRAVVFQEAGLLPWRTVAKNVALGLESMKFSRKERDQLAREYLAMTGLRDFGDAHPHELSGGMRQRVGLARALAVQPDVLLMDEPFAALDAQTRERMAAELLKIWEVEKKTVLFITHSIDEAIHLADRVIVMTYRPGRIRSEIPIELPRPRNEEVRATAEFAEYRRKIWSELKEEVEKAEREELQRK